MKTAAYRFFTCATVLLLASLFTSVGIAAETDPYTRLINLFDRYKPEKAVVIPPSAWAHQ